MQQEDFEIGKKIAANCRRMDMRTLAAATDQGLYATEAYAERFDSEDGEIGMIEAVITAFHGYLQAGGALDLGQGWQLNQESVRATIERHITRRDVRISQLQAGEQTAETAVTIGKLQHAVMTLIELHHDLRLCDCPDEAYAQQERRGEAD